MNFCGRTANIWQIVGKIYWILKIVIPVILIIWGTIALFKAALSSDEKALNKEITSMIKKVIAALIIFFVPTVIRFGFFMVTQFDDQMKEDAQNCIDCLTNPYNTCDTSNVGKEIFK